MTDDELVVLARDGDTDAFDQLVTRHQAAVYRAALAAVRVPEDAQEVAQDAFLRAWSNLGRFRGQASFRTWVLAITWNQALSRRRRVSAWFRRRAPLENAGTVAAGDSPPDHDLRCRELRAHAAQAIEGLSPGLRDALLLALSGQFAYAEIAMMLNVPVGTIKWRVSEARKQVRMRLAMQGYVNAR